MYVIFNLYLMFANDYHLIKHKYFIYTDAYLLKKSGKKRNKKYHLDVNETLIRTRNNMRQ